MSGYAFHPQASSDLDEIWEFIAADSLDAADRICDEIDHALSELRGLAESGT